ncbi:MAG: high-potential iron-sulfur protein [Methylophilaceae bacterium]
MNTVTKISRRAILKRGAALLTSIAILPILVAGRSAVAGTGSKADFNYQDSPRNGKSCATCTAFIPDGSGAGTCRILEGTVTPYGWCMAHSERK